MKNQVQKQSLSPLDYETMTADDVKKYFCPQATLQELGMFLQIAKNFKLNPFKREIYLVKYGNNPATILTGYEVYLKRAERTGKYAGFRVWTEGNDGNLKACIEVRRKDWGEPLYHEVEYSEYVQKTKEGRPNRFWAQKPKTMLKKVAISQGLRLAFPDELGGMPYTHDEMPSNNKQEVESEITEPEFLEPEITEPEPELPRSPEKLPQKPVDQPKINKGKSVEIKQRFKELHQILGGEQFNRILTNHGVHRLGDITTAKKAREVITVMENAAQLKETFSDPEEAI